MLMLKWEKLPSELKSETLKEYYDILKKKRLTLLLKRIMDILVSLIALIILLPFLLVIAIAIKIDSKGPVLYLQERITAYNKKFKIYKFRTMVKDADKKGTLITLSEDLRITRVGKIIRKYRLDELPQLINVLKGDMSLVGTRPEVDKYVKMYTEEMKATLLLPAGITSMASIFYRSEADIIIKYINDGENIDDIYTNRVLPNKMKYNLEYIKKISIFEDIKILFLTFLGVLKIKKMPEKGE